MEEGKVLWDEARCEGCDRCIAFCPYFASPKVREMSAEEVMEQVGQNLPFVRGITVSGGECTLYPQFLIQLFRLAKAQGLTCLIDSNGAVPLADYPELLTLCDGVMLDIKAWDPAVYTALTGASDNETVKQNLRLLAEQDKLAELRIVCLPGHVDAKAVLEGIRSILGPEKTAAIPLKLIRFRPNGVRGKLAQAPSPSDQYMEELSYYAQRFNFQNFLVL